MNKSAFASPISTKLLANRYQIKQLIGRGGMGNVFLANDILLGGIPVAIKFLSQTFTSLKMQEDFAREAQICAALSQKSLHIVRVTDYGVSPKGKPFYVMEYLCGKSLKDLVPVSLLVFLNLCRQICLGLQCAHQGIHIDGKIYPLVHRDIKPANVLVVPDAILGQLVKILDFGIAKFLNYSATGGTSNRFHGTLPYCSPEQLDTGELDNRSDIYSLGVMMFEMLTGEKPWRPETDFFGAWYKAHHFEKPRTITEVNPRLRVPRELANLIAACLAKSASDRPQNLAEVLQVLNSLKSSEIEEKSNFAPSTHLPTTSKSGLSLAVEQACKKLVWPQNKPLQEIVFPHLVETQQGTITALSLMMSQKEIASYTLCTRYNQFIFVSSPYPMLLWVTVLYNQKLGPKWLKSYLDMQNPQNQRLVLALATIDRYPLIFFTLEAPHSCTNVLSSRINPQQQQKLKAWVKQSQSLPPASEAQTSRNLLRQQYRQIQTQLLQKLQQTAYGF